ncbi:CotD family spore coat protein [Bacillus norwichensis]|uniref:Uncharacterized protein n=1 Tax=Bacillus norwichensis TaxID=2762217 RepID=A0ABR8VMM1_9BACI|nr:CotD family spore coat protein [Bacillus norwichensis]MBD8006019.1 hypothetical protein [Bacillus norwichensis]
MGSKGRQEDIYINQNLSQGQIYTSPEVITSPTRRVVNTNTTRRVRKHIQPTEVTNVNRTVIRNEYYFPVSQKNVNETVEENYNCGAYVNKPNCKPISGSGSDCW